MYTKVNGVNVFVQDGGHSEVAIVFLHFWGGSSLTWSKVTESLQSKFRVIRYDFRGWGQSDKPESGYDIGTLATDTLSLIETLKLNKYVLVGHSMGGKVAQAVAAAQPPGLQKLILIAPSPAVATKFPPEAIERMKKAYTSLEGINSTINEVFKAADLDPATRQQTIQDMQNHSDASRVAWPERGLSEDVSVGVNAITVPILVIAGQNDIVDSPDRLEAEVLPHLPNARMEIVSDTGHLLMLQKPQEVADLIYTFAIK